MKINNPIPTRKQVIDLWNKSSNFQHYDKLLDELRFGFRMGGTMFDFFERTNFSNLELIQLYRIFKKYES